MKEKSLISGGNQEKITTITKKMAHNERCLRKNTYLCT